MQIDIFVPSKDASYASMAADRLERYRTLLARHGCSLEPRPWPEGPGEQPTLALLAWGYHAEVRGWEKLLDDWPPDVPLLNPPALMRWNTRKTYLSDFERAGVPTVPTLFGDADAESVSVAFDRLGADELVVKPQISAGSDRTSRVQRGETVAPLEEAMIQPFLPSVAGEGEYSLFYFGGAPAHAIRKVAATGDFRVQPEFGSRIEPWSPDAEARATADAAMAAAPPGAVYVRIDLVRRLDGRLALMEFEAIEPDLYLQYDKEAGDRFAEALLASF
ncbi:MAG TPA: hypothetical protein VE567_03620 [Sphingomonas sp.]|nr:hypothetical protein [Sphingomonas sp.]